MKKYLCRNFNKHWGYPLKAILKMPREQFCLMFGNKYKDLSNSKFLKVIYRETPIHVVEENIEPIIILRSCIECGKEEKMIKRSNTSPYCIKCGKLRHHNHTLESRRKFDILEIKKDDFNMKIVFCYDNASVYL